MYIINPVSLFRLCMGMLNGNLCCPCFGQLCLYQHSKLCHKLISYEDCLDCLVGSLPEQICRKLISVPVQLPTVKMSINVIKDVFIVHRGVR